MAATEQTEPEEGTLNRALWRAEQMLRLDHGHQHVADEPAIALSDVLADLMHWAEDQEVNFEAALLAAQRSHDEELKDWLNEIE